MRKITTILLLALGLLLAYHNASAQTPVVRAVLFFSPTCPHCHQVMENDLPPILLQYGQQLEILAVDVTQTAGQEIYMAAVQAFQIPSERTGVPNLTIGNTVLVGSIEIPTYLPDLIEEGLANGGIDWPVIPGLDNLLASGTFSLLEAGDYSGPSPTIWQRFAQDPAGNSLATIVLAGMLVSVVYLWGMAGNTRRRKAPAIPGWLIPGLSVAGLFVAAYLTYVEVTQVAAFCGPIGDCNLVQQSPYARLLGIIPIGLLGLVGYAALLGIWAWQTYGDSEAAQAATRTRWWLALVGTIFSIYLTFLEPFVIGATCAWCLTSAILMTALLWVTTLETIKDKGRRRRRSAHS